MTPIDVAGWTLLDFLWEGTLIAAITAAVLALLRSASPQGRYAVACFALAAMVTAPVLTAALLVSPSSAPPGSATLPPLRAFAALATVAAQRASLPRADMGSPATPPAAVPQHWPDVAIAVVVTLWLAGVAMLSARLAAGWWRVRQMHRASMVAVPSSWQATADRVAARLGVSQHIWVVDSIAIDTPAVIGYLRPVVLLPLAALAYLTPAQIEAILVHELAHIRRHDYLVNLLQRVAETLLFYHPAVWWVSATIQTEREHCCDDLVVQVCNDAVGYAEALTELESRRRTRGVLVMAATGGALIARVRRLLGIHEASRSHSPRLAATGAVCVLAFLLVGGVQYLRAQPASGDSQTRADAPPAPAPAAALAWEVVIDYPDGRATMKGFGGRDLIRFAYRRPAQVLEGPEWLDSESFDLRAEVAGAPEKDDFPDLIRQLLDDRLQLTVHEETRDLPAYALVLDRPNGSLGPNLQPATRDCVEANTTRRFDAHNRTGEITVKDSVPRVIVAPGMNGGLMCGEWSSGFRHASVSSATMAEFAEQVRRMRLPLQDWYLGPAVVDRTGLVGRFDIDLDFFLPATALMERFPFMTPGLELMGFPSFTTALREQLGLRLENETLPTAVLIVDDARRPASN